MIGLRCPELNQIKSCDAILLEVLLLIQLLQKRNHTITKLMRRIQVEKLLIVECQVMFLSNIYHSTLIILKI